MPEQFGEKSYEATPHRRQRAREEGQVARSQDLASALLLLAGLLGLMGFGPAAAERLRRYAQQQLGAPAWLAYDAATAVAQARAAMAETARLLLPLLGLLLLAAVAAHLVQVGFLFVPQKLAWDPSRVDPLKGVRRIFSLSNALRLAFGLFKIAVVGGVAAWSLWDRRADILALSGLPAGQIAGFLAQITLWTCLKIAAALLVLAILDYGRQRWRHEQDLRMTHQEMKEEVKTLQGDPQIAARRRAIQRQLVLHRLQTAVPKADVVVTNPTELAVALAYDPARMAAPIVVAKGAGLLALRIRQLAREHDIPVVERKELARALYREVDVSRPIPAEQYAAVAEVLRYVYELKGRRPPGMGQAA